MFLVVMHTFFATNQDQPLIIAESEEKAQEWIDKEMEGYKYNGTGVHKIIPVKLYK